MTIFNDKLYDENRDGKLSDDEITNADGALELVIKNQKAEAQKDMAWVAMWSILALTGLVFTPLIPVDRLSVLSDLLSMFYIAQAGIIGAYFGMTAWMSKN